MRYLATADTDIGITKQTNQDSVLIKYGKCAMGEILLAVVCDGMGGFEKGELASATVIRKFSRWFDEELPYELTSVNLPTIGGKWSLMLKDLNVKISEYAKSINLRMGTTITGVLFVGDEYVGIHVGDSRLYYLGSSIKQLTTDQTFVARELSRGTLTPEQARIDKRRNMLLQCVGASPKLKPELLTGKIEKGAYMLCSDGFRHEISEKEIYESLNPANLVNCDVMHDNVKCLIEQAKSRKEKDNISVILIKVT